MTNPFKIDSKSYNDFELMQDLKWHCSKCELSSGQAKAFQIWRQKGIQLDTNEKGEFYKNIFCNRCNEKTTHRKLKSTELLELNKSRNSISLQLSKRIKKVLNYQEIIQLKTLEGNNLEIDHRFPQIRWTQPEEKNDSLSDEELKNKFMLLRRDHNLLKSRYCEKCFKDNIRGTCFGIDFWYEGNLLW